MIEIEDYFKNDDLARKVWVDKYRLNDETLSEFFNRLASEFARKDNFMNINKISPEKYADLSDYGKKRNDQDFKEKLLELFTDFKYIIPGGSVLAGLGSGKLVSLSNCFVTPTDDSIADIFNTARDMSQIYKRRGGNGTDLSPIRPAKAYVNNAAKTTGGIVPFAELYSKVTETIGQDGRRGALMLSLSIDHPDSPEFILAKQNLTKINGANISVRLTDTFMKAVEANEDYILRWPVDYECNELLESEMEFPYNILKSIKVDGVLVAYAKKIKAKELWDSIIQCAWNTAEPGILFWDTIIDNDPASVYPEFRAISTNPCGEIPLSPYDSCRLIAVNLFNLVDNQFEDNATINIDKAYKVFYEAQVIGDILVDLELEHVQRIIDATIGDEKVLWEKIYEVGQNGRRTGVGITGYGDLCATLGVDYGDVAITKQIMALKMKAESDATIDLAIINDPFPVYDKDLEYPLDGDLESAGNQFYQFLRTNFRPQYEKMKKYGRRNISWSTIAPTGTISIEAGTTSGCEPLFMAYYNRRKKCNGNETPDFIDLSGQGYTNNRVIHGSFKKWYISKNPLSTIEVLMKMPDAELDFLIENSPWYNNMAEDITPEVRIQTQSLLQKYTTHSISSTINLASDTPKETIDTLYRLAWKYDLKGTTVYRDGCRAGILTKTADVSSDILEERPIELECKVEQFKNEKKDWVAFIGIMNDLPYEIFTGPKDMDVFPIPSFVTSGQIIKVQQNDGTSRYDFRYIDSYGYTNTLGGLSRIFDKEFWNYARFVSALLRHKTPIEQVIKVVGGLMFTNKGMNNWKNGIERSLKPFVKDGTQSHGEICTECGMETIVYQSGCKQCLNCGNSKCA